MVGLIQFQRPRKLIKKIKKSFNNKAPSDDVNAPDGSYNSQRQLEAVPEAPSSVDPNGNHVRPFIKLRVVSWNLNMNLPSGELTELLGKIPANMLDNQHAAGSQAMSDASLKSSKRSSFQSYTKSIHDEMLPGLPLDDAHPYHLVVVGSQECPWVPSTFLGDLRGRQNVTWTDILEDYLCNGAGLENRNQPQQDEGEERIADQISSADHQPTSGRIHSTGLGIHDPALEKMGVEAKDFAHSPPASPTLSFVPISPTSPHSPTHPTLSHRTSEAGHLINKRDSSVSSSARSSMSDDEDAVHVGPYVLIGKERLMGIYIAVFVLKTCKKYIRGISKGRVAAGLLNGRVGNKGACGLSLHFSQFRLLFVSAHLAAHQDATAMRAANVNKIKEELEIDDFLPEKSKRKQDLTDRFDYIFWFGDLNYRLDVSRLHADWLLSTKSYQTALAFDQLSTVLKAKDSCFKGFKEAPIEFAPTYKYDLIQIPRRKLTRRNTQRAHQPHPRPHSSQSFSSQSQAFAESLNSLGLSHHSHSPLSPFPSSPISKQIQLADNQSDTASIASIESALVEFPSQELKSNIQSNDLRHAPSTFSAPPDPNEAKSVPAAVSRARVKFLGMVRSKSSLAVPLQKLMPSLATDATTTTEKTKELIPHPHTRDDMALTRPQSRPQFRSVKSELSLPTVAFLEQATFDTSKKQRVQSYTDRILYKSTILPRAYEPPAIPRRFGSGLVDSMRTLSRTFTHQSQNSTSTNPSSPPADSANKRKVSFSTHAPTQISPRRPSFKDRTTTINSDSSVESLVASPISDSDRSRASTNSYGRHSFSARQRPPRPHRSNSEPLLENNEQALQALEPTRTAHFGQGLQPKIFNKEKDRRFSFGRHLDSHGSHFHWRHWWQTFLHSPARASESSLSNSGASTPALPVEIVGPKRGEIDCIKYDAVADLRRMEAITDHRPIYAVFAIGAEKD